MSDAFFRVSGVTVDFGGVRALADVTFDVPRGQVCGLVGPNGSGKTTLLGVVSGLVAPSAGALELDGRRLQASDPARTARSGVARTFQNIRLTPDQTALENVMAGAGIRLRRRGGSALWDRRAQADLQEIARTALERVGVPDVAGRRPSELPYGHRRRVEIARVLAMDPALVLLDEPAAGMTAAERHELGDVIRSVADQGITQILVEHDFAMISALCGRVVVLSSGRLIADGTPAEVEAMPAVQEAYLGSGRQVRVDA